MSALVCKYSGQIVATTSYLYIFIGSYVFNFIHLLIWIRFAMNSISCILATPQCNPRNRIYSPLTGPDHGHNTGAAYLPISIFIIVLSFTILFLSMPGLWRVQMSKKKKILMTAVFSTVSPLADDQ